MHTSVDVLDGTNDDVRPRRRSMVRASILLSLLMVILVAITHSKALFLQRSSLLEKSTKSLLRTSDENVSNDIAAATISAIMGSIIASCNIINTARSLSGGTNGYKYSFSFSIQNRFQNVNLQYVDAKKGSGTSLVHQPAANIFATTEDGASFGGSSNTYGYIIYKLVDKDSNEFLMFLTLWWMVMDTDRQYWEYSKSDAENIEWQNYQACISSDLNTDYGGTWSDPFPWSRWRDYFKSKELKKEAGAPPGYAHAGTYNNRCARAFLQTKVSYQFPPQPLVPAYYAHVTGRPISPKQTGYTNFNFVMDMTYTWNKHAQVTIQMH